MELLYVRVSSVSAPIWDKAEALALGPYATSEYHDAMRRFRDRMLHDVRNAIRPNALRPPSGKR